MVSRFALLSNLLLASAALADSPGARLARRRQSARDASDGIYYNPTCAGANLQEGSGTFTTVTATFTVPTLSGSDGSASAWVSIDGVSCSSAILQTGIDFTLSGGVSSYVAWYAWSPDPPQNFVDFTINPGDVIFVTLTASSTTSATAFIENQTTGQGYSHGLTSSNPLCEQDVQWIVQAYSANDNPLPFPDFGTITFTEATAFDTSGNTYSPSSSDATIVEIQQNQNDVSTDVSVSGNTLTIQYQGPGPNVGPGN